jgi:hypothetical protein
MLKYILAFLLLATPALAQQRSSTNVTPIDCSGPLTLGGTAQNALNPSKGRQGFQIQNLDTSEALWINLNGVAAASTAGSYALASATSTTFQNGGSFYTTYGFNTAISIVAATTGHKYTCTVW